MLKNFKCYQLSLTLFKQCENIKTKYYIKDQLQRATLSVVLNLSEGSARRTRKDRARFYNIALASLRETQSLLDILEKQEQLKLADQIGACLYTITRNL